MEKREERARKIRKGRDEKRNEGKRRHEKRKK